MHKHVEGFRYTRPRDIITLDDRLIGLRTADDIIRLEGQQFLQDIRRTIGLQCPHLHFTETLATELSLTTQRLLRDKTVRSDTTGVHLIINHVMQFDYVNDPYRCFLVEAIPCFTIIKVSVTETRQTSLLDMFSDLFNSSTVKDWSSKFHTKLLTGPA